MSVSPAFFDVLGVRLALGPGFKPEREYTRFTATDVVLSHGAWQRLFGGRPDAIGATVTFTGVGDDDSFAVVGVLPKEFAFVQSADVWTPEVNDPAIARRLRGERSENVVARLRPGATIAQARAELATVMARLAADHPVNNAGWTVGVETLHDSVLGDFGRATWLMLAAVAVVLLVACLNVGGLLVARAISRGRETAVRVSLGAGPWRLLRLWLAEASLLSGAGAVFGLLLAWLGVSALKAAAPPGIPRLEAVALDGPTLAVAVLSTLLAVAIFTAAPLGRTPRRQLVQELRSGSAASGERRGHRTLRAGLLAAQCAGAATLVVLAVMLTRSFVRLTSFDLGWDAGGVLSLQSSPRMPRELRRPWFARVAWTDRLVMRLEAAPGVTRAAVTTQLPLGPSPYADTIGRGRGRTADADARWSGTQHKVTDGYFELMGVRPVAGRLFGSHDRFTEAQMNSSEHRPDAGVAVVTDRTARTLWPGESAIGRAIWVDFDSVKWRQVVGVVEDIQFGAVGEAPGLHVFVPWTQDSASSRIYVLLGTTGGADAMAGVARDIVQTTEPGAVVDAVAPLDGLVARATAQPRFTSRVVAAFGALALALAAVGIYGTLSYVVSARTREIGIRLALGASRRSILSIVVRRGVAPALCGGLLGAALAFALARTFRALLFGIEPLDVTSFAGGAALLLAVVLAAALGPARRAAGIDPATTLRVE
jgi:predicted permease